MRRQAQIVRKETNDWKINMFRGEMAQLLSYRVDLSVAKPAITRSYERFLSLTANNALTAI